MRAGGELSLRLLECGAVDKETGVPRGMHLSRGPRGMCGNVVAIFQQRESTWQK